MSNLRKDLMLQVFLHANRDLDDFQRGMIRLVIGPDASTESMRDAIKLMDQKALLLSRAGWKPVRAEGDQVLLPSHYDRFPIEPTYFLVESGGYHWCIENFVKYITRFRFKNGIEDLQKAQRNLAMYLRYVAGEEGWSR